MSKGTDKSLTVSELHDLVAAAVEEAVAPLKERIYQLETQGVETQGEPITEEKLQLEPASRRLNLDDFDHELTEDSVEDIVSSGRKRVR